MANFNAWLNKGNTDAMDVDSHATSSWSHILRNPISITIVRGQTTLDEQTVRIEFDNQVKSEINGEGAGTSSRRDAVLYGVKNHPNMLIIDTDIQRGDKFALNGQRYRVVQTILVPGEIQATCEVLT